MTAPTPAQPPEGTPRTDAALMTHFYGGDVLGGVVTSEFARTLERETLALRQSVAELDAMFKAATWFTPEGLWTVYPLADRVRMAIAVCKECEDEDAAALKLPELRQSVERLERELAEETREHHETVDLALKSTRQMQADLLSSEQQLNETHAQADKFLNELQTATDRADLAEQLLSTYAQKNAELECENLELRAKHKDVEADAARYRYLRGADFDPIALFAKGCASTDPHSGDTWGELSMMLSDAELDAAIDSAIAAQEGK